MAKPRFNYFHGIEKPMSFGKTPNVLEDLTIEVYSSYTIEEQVAVSLEDAQQGEDLFLPYQSLGDTSNIRYNEGSIPVADYIIQSGDVIRRYSPLRDEPQLFQLFIKLGRQGQPNQNQIIEFVKKYGLLNGKKECDKYPIETVYYYAREAYFVWRLDRALMNRDPVPIKKLILSFKELPGGWSAIESLSWDYHVVNNFYAFPLSYRSKIIEQSRRFGLEHIRGFVSEELEIELDKEDYDIDDKVNEPVTEEVCDYIIVGGEPLSEEYNLNEKDNEPVTKEDFGLDEEDFHSFFKDPIDFDDQDDQTLIDDEDGYSHLPIEDRIPYVVNHFLNLPNNSEEWLSFYQHADLAEILNEAPADLLFGIAAELITLVVNERLKKNTWFSMVNFLEEQGRDKKQRFKGSWNCEDLLTAIWMLFYLKITGQVTEVYRYCPVCEQPILDPRKNQKYHDGCRQVLYNRRQRKIEKLWREGKTGQEIHEEIGADLFLTLKQVEDIMARLEKKHISVNESKDT